MDDSDQDFADICSKLLKRVRKKAGDAVWSRKAESQSSSQTSNVTADPSKKTRKKKDVGSESKPSQAKPSRGADWATTRRPEVNENALCDAGDSGPPGPTDSGEARDVVEGSQRAKDKVLLRMQQFKRASPHMLVHNDRRDAVPKRSKIKDVPPPEPGPSDAALAPRLQQDLDWQAAEALLLQQDLDLGLQQDLDRQAAEALLLQQDLDRQAAEALLLQQDLDRQAAEALLLQQDLDRQAADTLEDRGLFFCQICQRNLTHMTPEGRTQHLNRCLDRAECSPAPPPSPPRGADCPVCGKRFRSPKSRAAHLKRCSADMGVAPALLLQCLRRREAEARGQGAGPPRVASRGSKRKEPAEPSLPTRKRPRKKARPLDEDTRVALALSSSLLEREKELEREAAASLASVAPRLQWRPEAGPGRRKGGKRRKGGPPRPPALLLVQDAEAAQTRVRERVAALLLRQRAPSPATPPRSPSRLRSAPARPLWRRSALRDGDPRGAAQFYTPELRDLLLPRGPPGMTTTSISKANRESSLQSPVEAHARMTSAGSSTPRPPSPSPTPPSPSPSWAGTARLSAGSQALRDVLELAEEGRSLSQWLRDEAGGAGVVPDVPLSGFVPEKSEERAELSGFLRRDNDDTSSQPIGGCGGPAGPPESSRREAVALSRLSCDLSSMVNNPQLSDVQVQVDSGEVFFVHSFMLYARCPLLAQMVHESGFGVQEEGLPGTQRVLLGESPGEAVLALLRYLYTGRRPAAPGPLLPALLELATRFDLEELQRLIQLYQEEAGAGPREDAADAGQPRDYNRTRPGVDPARGDQDFTELLRSMWSEEEDGEGEGGEEATPGPSEDAVDRRVDGGVQRDRRLASGDGETPEERVNDEEMEEIYEFAATQRKLAEERDSTEPEEEAGGGPHAEEEDEETEEPTAAGDHAATKAGGPGHDETPVGFKADVPERSSGCQVPRSLSYSRLFSGSWDVCDEFPASPQLSSPQPSTSRGPQAPRAPQRRSPSRAFPRGDGTATRSDATCLQSSPSEIIDLSASPGPPSAPSLPLPGLSPGRHQGALDADASGDGRPGNPPATDTRTSAKGESPGPRSICRPASPDPPQRRAEPELIVLSDSSEEMDGGPVPAASRGPTPPLSPVWTRHHQQYTQIKAPLLHPGPCTSPPARGAEEGGGDGGQGSACDGVTQSPAQSPDRMGFSPEVSWLFPATPLQASRSTSSICTQTQSSMCRTRLFPRASPSPPPTSSSPRPKGRAQASGGRPPTDGPPAMGGVNRTSTGESKGPESSFDAQHMPVTFSPPAHYARPPAFPHLLLVSPHPPGFPTHGHPHPGPYSSTPLHTEPPKPPVPLETSLSPGDPAREGLGRGHLSRSDRSRSVSPSPLCKDRPGPGGDAGDGPSCSGRTLGPGHPRGNAEDPNTADSEKIGDAGESARHGGRERGAEGEERGMASGGGHERAAEPSFCQSFMDEPPMAFNDSWGLDAGGGGGEGGQAPCFSLRLEDSGGLSSHQHSPVSPHSLHPPLSPGRYPDGEQNPSASRSPGTPPTAQPLADPDTPPRGPEVNSSVLDPQLWDSWQEEEEEEGQAEVLPLSQRVNPAARFQTPVSSGSRKRTSLAPITPMPSYSDMDTPELKNKLHRFGVRPLPKRQMILKLRQIHQYTHQLVHSDEEDGVAPLGGPGPTEPLSTTSRSGPPSCAQGPPFKRPSVPPGASPVKRGREDPEPLSSSQGSSTSTSTAASEESERSNPELLHSSDSESDGEGSVTASQAACRQQDRVQAVRAFIQSDTDLYHQVLRYQPLVLSQLQARLKATGIRLGAAKLLDYLDSQCITVTTAKPGRPAAGRRRGGAKGERKRKTAPAAE